MASAEAIFWSDQTGAAMRERLDMLTDGRELTEAEKHGARLMLLTISPELVSEKPVEVRMMVLLGLVNAWIEALA